MEYFEYFLLLLYISVYKIYFNKTKFVSRFFIHRERINLKRKRIEEKNFNINVNFCFIIISYKINIENGFNISYDSNQVFKILYLYRQFHYIDNSNMTFFGLFYDFIIFWLWAIYIYIYICVKNHKLSDCHKLFLRY